VPAGWLHAAGDPAEAAGPVPGAACQAGDLRDVLVALGGAVLGGAGLPRVLRDLPDRARGKRWRGAAVTVMRLSVAAGSGGFLPQGDDDVVAEGLERTLAVTAVSSGDAVSIASRLVLSLSATWSGLVMIQLGGVGAAGVPPLAQDAGLPPGAVVHQQLLGARSPGETADRAAGQGKLPDDLGLAERAFGQQAVHVSVAGPGAG
jgi:hypothetical protein